MARRRAVVGVVLAGVLAFLGALALRSYDATALGRAVLARAGAVTGVTLTGRAFRLRPLTGLAVEGLEGSAAFTGGRATVSVDRLVLDHRLWRLLLGELAVERLVLHRPRIRLTETRLDARAPARVPVPAAAGLGRLALRVSRIDVEDGTIEMQALGEPRPVVVSGLDLALREVAFDAGRAAMLSGLSGAGEVRVEQVAFARTQARDVRGALRLGGGRLSTGTVRFHTPQGPFDATLDAQLDRLPFAYTLSLRGEPLDIGSMMAGGSRGPGAGALRLDGRGLGAEATGLHGKGVLRLQAGALPATPLLTAIDRILGRTRLVGARYEATEAPFRVEGGRVRLDDLRLRTEQIGMDVAGWASLEGPLELTLAIHTPREGLTVEGVAAGVLDLMTDDQGQVVIPLKVTGTQEQPRVRPDGAALAGHARRSGARTLLDKAGRGLGGLLRGKGRAP
jgi:uncharacterized protein involved in outer membrane biogenesis